MLREGSPITGLGEHNTTQALAVFEQPAVTNIQHLHSIAVVCSQPAATMRQLGLPEDYTVWFDEGLALDKDRYQLVTIHAKTDELPSVGNFDAIIIGGSGHSVYDKDQPWIPDLQGMVRQADGQGVKVLGVCFGHQLIATTYGGTVEEGAKGREFGVVTVRLTPEGMADRLFADMPKEFPIATSHGDVVTKLPQSAVLFVSNDKYSVQGFGIGKNIRGVQFHPEITRPVAQQLVKARTPSLLKEAVLFTSEEEIQAHVDVIDKTPIEIHGKKILENFVKHFVEREE